MLITQNIGDRTIAIREGGILVIVVDEQEGSIKSERTGVKYASAISNFLRSGCPMVQLIFSCGDVGISDMWASFLRNFFDLVKVATNVESFIISVRRNTELRVIEISRKTI